jgi:hypothetical protein
MTDQFTSLSSAAIREIIAKLDAGLRPLNERKVLSDSEAKIKKMMTELRETLIEKLAGMKDPR